MSPKKSLRVPDTNESNLTSINTDKDLLVSLLDKLLEGEQQNLFAQKTEMGGTEAYVSSVTIEWFANYVNFAANLPLLQDKYNSQTDNIEIDADSIDEIQQRPLDWSRQAALVQYLASRKHHKFPPVLVVINQPWVDNLIAPEWDGEGKAIKSSSNFTPIDKEGKIGVLDISEKNVTIYALDGQHRLIGIQGLIELLKTGQMQRYKKDKTPYATPLTLDDLYDQYQVSPIYLQNLPQEKIGIEFISAVVAGETREEARRRIRSIFVHVNLMAVALTKGQLTQLDEDDGFSIVARKIAVTHPFFEQKENRKPRINWNSATVANKSTVLTTLQALKEMSGREKDVATFIANDARTEGFLYRLEDWHRYLLPLYFAEGKHYFRIGIGCTGGKHRSVFVAEWLAERLKSKPIPGMIVNVLHRDLEEGEPDTSANS